MEKVANCYAVSLFDLAKEEKDIEGYLRDIQFVQDVFSSDASLIAFFSHVLVDDDAKCDLIDQSFKGQINGYVVNFLKLLIKKRRIRYILEISKDFKKLCNEYFGIEEGILYTSFEISPEMLKQVELAVGKKEKKTVHLKVVIDPSLIGGIKIEIKNRIYDGTLMNKVTLLKKELLRK